MYFKLTTQIHNIPGRDFYIIIIIDFLIPTKENTAADAPDAFHDRRVMHFEIALARSGSIGAVHVVQVTAHRFVAVFQVHVLQQPIAQRAHAEKRAHKFQ